MPILVLIPTQACLCRHVGMVDKADFGFKMLKKMIYENLVKVRGPYESSKDHRLRCVLVFSDKTEKTMSYPKYLMEIHLNRYLTENETIDHIDGNPLNNNIDNLRVLDRKEHCTNDALRNKDIKVTCAYCGKEFYISGAKIGSRNRKDRHQSGYFCSRVCSGKYGAEIQNQKRTPVIVDKIVAEKFTQHSKN